MLSEKSETKNPGSSYFAKHFFLARLAGIAAAFGEEPFVFRQVVKKTSSLRFAVGDDGSCAFDKMLRSILFNLEM